MQEREAAPEELWRQTNSFAFNGKWYQEKVIAEPKMKSERTWSWNK